MKTSIQTAREAGEQAATACLAKTQRSDPEFSAKATEAILAFMKEFLSFDKREGVFRWRISYYRVLAGQEAGVITPYGYRRLKILGRSFFAHRLAWLHEYGVWPSKEIDHIDGNRLNNRISNLRDVSKSVNQQNVKKAPKSNRSTGLLGVTLHKRRIGEDRPYGATITVNQKKKHLGYFATAEDAQKAYLDAKSRLHEGYSAVG